jgi:hypothetical protein
VPQNLNLHKNEKLANAQTVRLNVFSNEKFANTQAHFAAEGQLQVTD